MASKKKPKAHIATIHTKSADYPLTAGPDFDSKALWWYYHSRSRPCRADETRFVPKLRRKAFDLLKGMGLAKGGLTSILRSDIVEVSMPFTDEDTGWATRILPWEFLLTATAKRPLLVVRHLQVRPAGTRRPPTSMLFVDSAPGALSEAVGSFDSKRRVVLAHLEPETHEVLETPTLPELRKGVRAAKADVIHVSGIDTWAGASLIEEPADDKASGKTKAKIRDGLYLKGRTGSPLAVHADELAKALSPAAHAPQLVTFTVQNSGSRLAALAVAHGAQAAIGLQDDMDDTLAERFFAAFYRAWKLSDFDTLRAFELAQAQLSDEPLSERRNGIVLWSRSSLIDGVARRRGRSAARRTDEVREQLREERRSELQVSDGGTIRDLLEVDVQPRLDVNYSLLHNNGDLFQSFKVRKFGHGVLRDVKVEVELHIGSDSFPYRTSLNLDKPVQDISRAIRVPLTWALMRTLRESVRVTLYVNVTHQETVVHQDTYAVVLGPAEEWRDNKRDGIWLPSFALPRDPMVARIIDQARVYLKSLADFQGQGFDGYQSPPETVDLQVRAIWSVLSFGMDIGYSNPLPTYTAQRLRSPTDIIEGRMGTCLDLAMLMASCLEYVEIFPVIFMLTDHAFPGYWRSEEAWSRFQDNGKLFETSRTKSVSKEQAWMVERDAFGEIVKLVERNHLVPIESTMLATHAGFDEAFEGGTAHLLGEEPEEGVVNPVCKQRFDTMVDINLARWGGITPLPLRALDE